MIPSVLFKFIRLQVGSEITATPTGFSVMTTESEFQTKGDVLPGLIESLGRLATDSAATTFNRLEAIDLLLRLAIGPRNRPSENTDVAAGRDARIALWGAVPFLDQTMASKNHRARIRLHAASLASLVGKLPSRAGHAN
jgi:hypothetical protein